MWGTDDFTADTVDESASMADHTGAASVLNAASGERMGASKSLVLLWFLLLALYWALGALFKGALS